MKSMKSVTCKCERCNKPFKAYVETEHPLCKSCKEHFEEEKLKRMTGQSVPKTMTRTPLDAIYGRTRNLGIKAGIGLAELQAEEDRESAVAQTIKCKDCGEEFSITVGEKEWYESKKWNIPARCPACRRKRKKDRNE